MKMNFNDYMERFWKGYSLVQRELVESDALYQFHHSAQDEENACTRAVDIMRKPKLRKETIEERAWKQFQDFIDQA